MTEYVNELFSMPKVHILTRREIQGLLSNIGEALKAVEYAFKLSAEGRVIVPPKLYLDLPQYQGDFRAMPAYIDGIAGVKWVCSYPNNSEYDLPSVMAIIILCDPNTGCPVAIMDGRHITTLRTGAAGGVAVKYLARRHSSIIGMVGAGVQAKTQLLAISKVLPRIEEVRVFDKNRNSSLRYAEEMGAALEIRIRSVGLLDEATEADIVVTTTPSTEPVVKKKHIRAGTHINAIGADAKGKQELDADLVTGAKVVVDDIEQASHSGEINVPLSQGLLKVDEIYGTLGEVVAHMKKGRENDEEITIFDSTGLAVQDIVCAKIVYQKASEKKLPVFELL
jgi:alanine dehydrogenase